MQFKILTIFLGNFHFILEYLKQYSKIFLQYFQDFGLAIFQTVLIIYIFCQ